MEILDGKITNIEPTNGTVTVVCPLGNTAKFLRQKPSKALVVLQDSRTILPEQRKKAYALINEIANFSGTMPEYIKKLFKLKFLHEQLKDFYSDMSLGNCSVEVAREFISFLIDFVIDYEIPTKVPLIELCDDIDRYVYQCVKRKICAVCGQKADLHHITAVGMGRDREEIIHENMEVLTLCRSHHTECHTIGWQDFKKKYHFEKGVTLDKNLCKIYKLKKEQENE